MMVLRAAALAALCLCFTVSIAVAQSLDNPLGIASDGAKSGSLVICGGGRLPEPVYEGFIHLAGGKEARIVHIPWAHPFSSMSSVRYSYNGWTGYDVESFDFLNVDAREEADVDKFLAPLENATGVWIGGGSQGRLTNLYGGTKVEAALQRVLARGGVIGGTSAGASVMSSTMIRYGTATEAVTDKGLNLVQHAVIDQHFSQRNRLERLLGVIEQQPAQVGIGVDEGTALFVQSNRLKVMGSSRVTICLPEARGAGISLHRLKDGDDMHLIAATTAGNNAGNNARVSWELRRRSAK